MEVENKNVDGANDSVESFEDAVDSLEITEEHKPEKTEATEQLNVLLSDTNTSKKENNDTTKSTESKPTPDFISVSVDDKTVSLESKSSKPELKISALDSMTSDDVLKPTNAPDTALSSENLPDINSKQSNEEKSPTEAMNLHNSNANSEEKPTQNNVESITNILPDLVINEVKIDQKVSEPKDQSISEVSNKEIEGTKIENITAVSNVEITKNVVEKNLAEVCEKDILAKDSVVEVTPKESSPEPSKEETKEIITPINVIPKEYAKEIISVELTNCENPKKLPETDTTDSSLVQGENDSSDKIKSDTYLNDNKAENSIRKEDGEFDDNDEDDEGSIKSEERECGDGQGEQDDAKKELDHDEDKRNPEYIPKKGSFYEHDTRTMDGFDDDVKKIEEETAARSKKKPKPVSSEGRWAHDKFNDLEQGPKSQQEIIDTYGYDIRNEEHPPKARRNRRYGRGPNKYNRNWEDEKAYLKVEKQPRPPGTRGPRQNSDRSGRPSGPDSQQEREEFPPLARGENEGEKRSAKPQPPTSVDNKGSADNEKSGGFQYADKIGMKAEKGAWVPPPPFSQKNVVNKNNNVNKNHLNRTSNESEKSHIISHPTNVSQKDSPPQSNDKPSPPKPKSFVPLNNASFAPTNSPRTNFRPPVPNNVQQSLRGEAFPNVTKGARSRLPESGLIRPRANWEPNNWYINQKVETTGPPESPDLSNKDYSKLPGAGPVALRGGKRYSVQRQQSLPDPTRNANSYGKDSPVPAPEGDVETPQTASQGGQSLTAYYHHATTGTAPPITVPQSSSSHLVFTQSPPPPTPAAPIIKGDYVNLNIAGETPIYHSNSFQPAPVYTTEPTHPISNGGGAAPPPMLLPVHFVSPPPNQVPPFNGSQAPIMNYAPQPMQFQPMQPIVSLPPPPQAEVFQPAGGITYYSPQTQAVLQRPALSKRVKSAIPIVPPNELSNLMQQSASLQNNLLQQKQHLQSVPVEINKDEPMSN